MNRVEYYLESIKDLLSKVSTEDIKAVADLVLIARTTGKHVYIIGNGGSASTASHFACDLQKGAYVKAMALTDSVPLMTAYANDEGYNSVFVQQVETWVKRGDLVIAISGSGDSQNIINAVDSANFEGAVTIGFSGFEGGGLAEIAQHNIIVPSENMQHIEDVHMVLCHLIFRYVLDSAEV